MEDFILDKTQRARYNLDNIVKVRDESGNLIGRFVSDSMFREMFEAWADSFVTKEEIEAARKDYQKNGGLTTSEAIAYVRRAAGETS